MGKHDEYMVQLLLRLHCPRDPTSQIFQVYNFINMGVPEQRFQRNEDQKLRLAISDFGMIGGWEPPGQYSS